MGFYVFAHTVAVSHAYSHIVEFGEPVEIGGLKIKPGDLLHGDRHGVQSVPLSIAPQVPGVVAEQQSRERRLIEFLGSADFSLETLKSKIDGMR
jgi:regulator of RNase E activity RraA